MKGCKLKSLDTKIILAKREPNRSKQNYLFLNPDLTYFFNKKDELIYILFVFRIESFDWKDVCLDRRQGEKERERARVHDASDLPGDFSEKKLMNIKVDLSASQAGG